MKKYLVYDSSGEILRWGISSNATFASGADAGPNEKVMAVKNLGNNFDLDNRVANPTGPSPTIIKKRPK